MDAARLANGHLGRKLIETHQKSSFCGFLRGFFVWFGRPGLCRFGGITSNNHANQCGTDLANAVVMPINMVQILLEIISNNHATLIGTDLARDH